MFENITEVIGFDLGHGETALAQIYVDDLDQKSEPDLIEIFGREKNIITAIGYHPRKGILIGRAAITIPGVEESHITFKKKPSSDPNYRRVMSDYIRTIYNTQIEQARIQENKSFFIVGCPSEWTRDPVIVDAYEKLFSDAGIPRVKVVAESRAAYINAVEKGILNIAESRNSLIVIDIGSSTTDITFIDRDKNSIPIDVGRELGAALIEKAIFQQVLRNDRDKIELNNILDTYPHLKNRCELACRDVKEKYFSAPGNYYEPGEYVKQTEEFQGRYFTAKVDRVVMNEILDTPIVDLGGGLQTWPSAFRGELERLKYELGLRLKTGNSDDFSGAILLTGGASRMNFVREICQEVFPQASVKLDSAPEFCIARGLARWGRVEINTSQFSKDVEIFCSSNIRPRVAEQIDPLYDAISVVLADKIIGIIKHKFDSWKSRGYHTINSMRTAIDKEIEDLLIEKNLNQLFEKEIKSMLDRLDKELSHDIKSLESQYRIPIGKLGESFDLRNITVGRISFGSQPNIDATGGLMSQFGDIVAWISGILAGVATYVVGPTVLGIIVGLTALVSTTLFSILIGFLITNPGGWAVLATFGILVTASTLIGKKLKNQLKMLLKRICQVGIFQFGSEIWLILVQFIPKLMANISQ